MRALNYYTVGEDALPIPGLDIGYFEKHTSFGMFEFFKNTYKKAKQQ